MFSITSMQIETVTLVTWWYFRQHQWRDSDFVTMKEIKAFEVAYLTSPAANCIRKRMYSWDICFPSDSCSDSDRYKQAISHRRKWQAFVAVFHWRCIYAANRDRTPSTLSSVVFILPPRKACHIFNRISSNLSCPKQHSPTLLDYSSDGYAILTTTRLCAQFTIHCYNLVENWALNGTRTVIKWRTNLFIPVRPQKTQTLYSPWCFGKYIGKWFQQMFFWGAIRCESDWWKYDWQKETFFRFDELDYSWFVMEQRDGDRFKR